MKKRKIKTQTKDIKGYRLVYDAIGAMPVWSLQHPIYENEESYRIIDIEDEQIAELLQALEEVDRLWFGIYITGEIKYTYYKKMESNVLIALKIDKIELFDEKECS